MAKAATAAKTGTEVATQKQTGLPAEYAGLEEFAGQGLEDLDSSDKSIPFIKVLEKGSPEIETVDGAKPGMFINTATLQLYNSIRFVPACRDHMFVEWKPIDAGGGLIATHGLQEQIAIWAKSQRGKIVLKNGNELIETFYLFGFVMPEDGDDSDPYPAVISFTSTRIKAYKSIVNRSDSITLPRANGAGKFKAPWFCHVWRITSEKKVDGNQSWYVYNAAFDSPNKDAEGARLPADHPVIAMGAEMVRQKAEGALKMNQDAAAGDQPDIPERETSSAPAGKKRGPRTDEDMEDPPF